MNKLDANGNYLWGRTWGGNSVDLGLGVEFGDGGNVYAVGSFRDTVDFSHGDVPSVYTSNGWNDAFMCKFDPFGNLLWTRAWGGPMWDECAGVAGVSLWFVYVTGYFTDTADMAPSYAPCNDSPDIHTGAGGYDLYVAGWKSTGCW